MLRTARRRALRVEGRILFHPIIFTTRKRAKMRNPSPLYAAILQNPKIIRQTAYDTFCPGKRSDCERSLSISVREKTSYMKVLLLACDVQFFDFQKREMESLTLKGHARQTTVQRTQAVSTTCLLKRYYFRFCHFRGSRDVRHRSASSVATCF